MVREKTKVIEKWFSVCLYLGVSVLCFFFHCRASLRHNWLACAPVSSREVIDVCSTQKACWETAFDLGQDPWTSRVISRTWPNAFRNSQMAPIVGFTVPNMYCMCMFVCVCVSASLCLSAYEDKVGEADSKWRNIFYRNCGCFKILHSWNLYFFLNIRWCLCCRKSYLTSQFYCICLYYFLASLTCVSSFWLHLTLLCSKVGLLLFLGSFFMCPPQVRRLNKFTKWDNDCIRGL